jgi:thioesterase domain-containing protein
LGTLEPWNLGTLVSNYLDELREVQPRGPYHLGGFCFGGVLAFEAARQLAEGGEACGLLALIDVTPADFPSLVSSGFLARYRVFRVAQKTRRLMRRLGARPFWQSPGYLARESIRAVRRRLPSTADGFWDGEVPDRPSARAVVRAHRVAFERYRPVPGTCAVTLVLPKAIGWYSRDPVRDWSAIATRGVSVSRVESHPDGLLKPPAVARVATVLFDRMRPPTPSR